MSRILESVFIIGCSLVGFSMSAPDGSTIRQTVQCSVKLVALAQNNVASNTARLTANLVRVPVQVLGRLRVE